MKTSNYKQGVIAKALTYSEELHGTPTGSYLKMLLDSMSNKNTSFYFPQLEGAVLEAEHLMQNKDK